MKLEYLEPFVDSTVRVLNAVLGSEVQKGDLTLLSARDLAGSVGIVIGLQDSEGESIILNMNENTAMGICRAMNGETFERMDELAYDTLGEVANMIAGSAVTYLNDLGFELKIRVPVSATLDQIARMTRDLELFQVALRSPHGLVTVNFMMRTN